MLSSEIYNAEKKRTSLQLKSQKPCLLILPAPVATVTGKERKNTLVSAFTNVANISQQMQPLHIFKKTHGISVLHYLYHVSQLSSHDRLFFLALVIFLHFLKNYGFVFCISFVFLCHKYMYHISYVH